MPSNFAISEEMVGKRRGVADKQRRNSNNSRQGQKRPNGERPESYRPHGYQCAGGSAAVHAVLGDS